MSDPDQTAGYESFVKNLLATKFGIPLDTITTDKHAVGNNNHVYMITLSEPTTRELAAQYTPSRPLTHPIPAGTSRLVVRIPRSESNLEDSIRIRNEVSMLALARNALADVDPSLVARVYGWDDTNILSEDSPSYIVQEFLGGDVLTGEDLEAMDGETRASFLRHLASIIKAFQTYPLPAGITGHGGVTFDDEGTMMSTKCVIRMGGGPFATYREMVRATILWQLDMADTVPWFKGWREEKSKEGVSLRERIDKFIANGLDKELENIPEHKPVIIHGDFMPPNLHWDKAACRLTGIVDFDFGHVAHPISEPMFSFVHFQGFLSGLSNHRRERELLLSGHAGPVDDADADKHAMGLAWEAALTAEDVVRPSLVENAEAVSNLWWFGQELCEPFWLTPRMMAGFAKGKEEKLMKGSAEGLDKYLKHWGY